LRQQVDVPVERKTFATKPELGLKMILRAKKRGLPFEAVRCDALYGRSSQFRHQLDEASLLYMAAIPANLRVYLQKPEIGLPEPQLGKRGPKAQTKQVVHGVSL
jgi:SRSO17 transposase